MRSSLLKILAVWVAAAVFALSSPSLAQTGSPKTPTQLNAEVNLLWPDQNQGTITPSGARQTLLDIISSANIIGPGGTFRTQLSANADYYVSKAGNDSNNGTSLGTAWLTINKALASISQNIDLNGFNVIVHVQGANIGSGIYTENLLVPGYVGYNGNGFSQFIVQAENGATTLNGATAGATILAAIGGNATPIQFKNFVLGNPNASGIILEADDGGFIALNNITFASTGAGGILAECTQMGGRLLFMAGTHSIQNGFSTGTGFYGRAGCGIIFQPGVTINFGGATTFSNAVADFATNAYFDNTGSTWSGTVPTGHSFVLDKNTGGLIVNTGLIPGSLGATLTPVQIASGGIGAATLPTGALKGNGTSAITQAATGDLSDVTTPSTTCGANTPTLSFGGLSVGITYSVRTCQYVKVGKLIIVELAITLTSKGSSVGAAMLSGFPAAANITTGACAFYAAMSGVTGSLTFNGSGTSANLYMPGAVAAAGLADTNFTNTSVLQCTIPYISS